MGLTNKGWQRRTYDEILNDKIQRAKELLGEDIDTSELSALGKYLRINAYDQAIAEEEIEQVYYARFPNTASGQNLDRLAVFAGITRNPATAAVYSVKVSGQPEYVIKAGFLVSTETDINFSTVQDYTIGEDGTCVVEVICTESGIIGNLPSASDITQIVNPDVSIESVKGLERVEEGADEENDADFRVRFKAAAAGSGSCNENAIRSAILRIPTVQYASVISNNTNTEDGAGRPPHSFECYVMGGENYDKEIAEAIFSKRPIGITTVGEKAVSVTDATGNEHVVRFSPAQNVMITVRIKIKTTTAFQEDGIEQIRTNVSNHINDLGIGASLVLSTLYGCIYSVPGVNEVSTLELSTDGNTFGTANVTIPIYGAAVCDEVLVEVVA